MAVEVRFEYVYTIYEFAGFIICFQLVSLKAELSRKQDEVKRAKVQGAYLHPVPKPKKQTIFSKKNAGIAERVEKDTEEQKEEEDVLKKSRWVYTIIMNFNYDFMNVRLCFI